MSDRVLTKLGRANLENILARTTVPGDLATQLPDGWTEPAIPAQPGPGAYLINGHLVARAAWDNLDDCWRYLGNSDDRRLREDMTWSYLWDIIGTPDAAIESLAPVGHSITLPALIRSVYGNTVRVRFPQHVTAAVDLCLENPPSALLTSDAALDLAAALVEGVRQFRQRS